MSKFCSCMDNEGYCCHTRSPYFLDRCPIPINQDCPMGCNNPEFDEPCEEYEEEDE